MLRRPRVLLLGVPQLTLQLLLLLLRMVPNAEYALSLREAAAV